MADLAYRRVRGFDWNTDDLTASRAAALFVEARATAYSGVRGDLDAGFDYWSGYDESTGPLVHVHVRPLKIGAGTQAPT